MKLWLFGDGRQSGANRSERLRCETARILVACLGRSVLQTWKGPYCSDLVDALETGRLRKSGQSITFRVALLCSCVSRRACMVVCICLECECLFSLMITTWKTCMPPRKTSRWEIFVSCQNSQQKKCIIKKTLA